MKGESDPLEDTLVWLREVATRRQMSPREVERLLFETFGEPPVSPPLPEGGRYRLISQLGRGGMGIVHRAYDRSLRREVALKVLSAGAISDDEQLDRFQREARAIATLDHPHIVRVLDVGELPAAPGEGRGRPYIAMELLEGEDLAHAIGRGSLSTRDVVEIARQISLALGYAHQKGILHRDVKPGNVFLRRRQGEQAEPGVHALLVDFGLAKLVERGIAPGVSTATGAESVETLTRTGQLLGTPAYMAPEQIRGAQDIDGRADVYSLGATLYHALAGRPPFQAPSLSLLLNAVIDVDPISVRRLDRRIPRDIETICMKCLGKDSRTRYERAEDLAEDCRRFLAGEPLRARPPGALGRLVRWTRRHPYRAVTLAVATITLVIVGIRFFGPQRILLTTDPPNARVLVNGGPYQFGRWILPGSIQVRCEAEGYEPKTIQVELWPLEYRDIGLIRLDLDHGWLDLDSEPPGADVLLDDVPLGRTPLQRVEVRNGVHAIQLRLDGYAVHRSVVSITPASIVSLGRLPLSRELGYLSIQGVPADARVEVTAASGEGAPVRYVGQVSRVLLPTGAYRARRLPDGAPVDVKITRGEEAVISPPPAPVETH